MNLVIVESPTKAKTLRRFLGDAYEIEASMGHVRDLPKSTMGVDIEHDFEPKYEISKDKSGVVTSLRKKAATADLIYLATDPDREGEAISWHILNLLTEKKKTKIPTANFKRVTFHEITKRAIDQALTEPGEINMALVDAQQSRRVLDRLVGYSLSPLLWKKVRRGLSAGRVQSVAVRLIVEREREIRSFLAVEYWKIGVELKAQSPNSKDQFFLADLMEVDGKKVETKDGYLVNSVAIAEPIVQELKRAAYVVKSVERKEQSKRANPPYTTSTLQQAAANVLGWSGKQTMMVAQQLYEAGLITYHRTDSFNIAAEVIEMARREISSRFGTEYLPDKPNFFQTKSKNAQEAHEAIRPTDVKIEGGSLKIEEAKQQKLYMLIWRRFVACQMKPVVFDQTTINIQAERYGLKASGSVVKFDGWRRVYGEKNNEVLLPKVDEGEKLDLVDVTSEQKFTEPPPRYNDASIVKELEKRGIGRPSTYASILSTIVDRGYVERVDKRYHPTLVGEAVSDFLVANFGMVMDYQFTAEMEDKLDAISRGETAWKHVMADFWKSFGGLIQTAEKQAERVEIPVEKTGTPCPECKTGELVIRTGRFGKFLSCGRFPECKYRASLRQAVEGVVCPDCQSEIVQKRTRTGRTFWGCSSYPKCKWASWQDPRKKLEVRSVGGEK